MGAKTVSPADDACEKSKTRERDGESFSDVVRRLAGGVTLSEYFGVLDEEAADDLKRVLEERRKERSASHRKRVSDITDELDG